MLRNLQMNFLFLTLVGLALASPTPDSKIDHSLLQSLKAKSSVNIIVRFQNGNKPALQLTNLLKSDITRDVKTNSLVTNLKNLATSTQKNAIGLLKARASTFQQLWITNELYVAGASELLIHNLAALSEVVEVREERVVTLNPETDAVAPNAAEWNIELIEAPNAWVLPGGNNGQNSVVGVIDTGARHTHEALRNNFRSPYGWFDPYNGASEPFDDVGHGSHVTGIAVGAGGIGVAPGAQWISCVACPGISCAEVGLKACGEWMLCPTNPDGTNPDCSKAPNVISNSWGAGSNDPFYNEVLDAWREAEIVPVFAIGNSGPTCGSVASPGDQPQVIGVGSSTEDDSLSMSSSAGPSKDDRMKPDITAPGQLVRSAWGNADDAYIIVSGTSMAAPHVAGAAALLLSSNPDLTVDEVKDLLQKNADKNLNDVGLECGGRNSTTFPNNHYGHGRVNARKSLEAVINN